MEEENRKLREDLGRLRELVARGSQEDGQARTKCFFTDADFLGNRQL